MMFARRALRLQGGFYLLTGLWPLISMSSFEAVTGRKTDKWLVRMVALLAAVIGLAVLLASRRKRIPGESLLLASGSAAGFAAVDLYYVIAGRISRVYLLDALAEAVILGLLLAHAVKLGRPLSGSEKVEAVHARSPGV